MTRKGKIARLPRKLRDQLNRRLSENQDGGIILKWLNHLSAMKTIVANEFDGVPVSKQNLSEWRNGGFAEWQTRQETIEQARELAADAEELTEAIETTNGKLTDHLLTVVAARYAALISGWNGEEDEAFTRKLRILRSLSHDIVELRRSDQRESRLQMEKIRLDRDEERTEEEVVEHFQRWVETEKVREVILKDHMSPADRDREFRRIFDLPEPAESTESMGSVTSAEQAESPEPEPEDQVELPAEPEPTGATPVSPPAVPADFPSAAPSPTPENSETPADQKSGPALESHILDERTRHLCKIYGIPEEYAVLTKSKERPPRKQSY